MESNINELVSMTVGQSNLMMLLNTLGSNDLVETVCKKLQQELIGTSESQNDKRMCAQSIVGDNVYSKTSLQLPAISSATNIDASRGALSTGDNGEVNCSATPVSREENNENEATTEQEIFPSLVLSKSHILVQDKPIKIAKGHHNCCRSDEKHSASKRHNESLPPCEQVQPKQLRRPNGRSPKSVKDAFWMNRYKELVEYERKNGHTQVPQKYPPSPQLGTWICKQRKMYKDKNLSRERVNLLSKIGFVWNIHELIWREQFLKLVEYKQVHGHTYVPYKYEKDRKLSTWVKKQRLNYRRLQRGEKCGMTIERLEALNDIEFEWDGRGNCNRMCQC